MMKSENAMCGTLGLLGAMAAVLLLGACSDPKSAAGFRLPDGDVAMGRTAFARLNCHQCHTVAGETFAAAPGGVVVVPLGGEVTRVSTYGQLVTSIINPQHIIDAKYEDKYTDAAGRSMMPDYNATMTVKEVIDLVAFLQAHYKLVQPPAAYPYSGVP